MKRLIFIMILICIIVTPLMAEKITLWTAPNMYQEQFWKIILEEWKEVRPDIEVEWKTIPASGSSEEAILTAIVTDKTPDLCTNIFSGFAAQLIEADQLVALNTLEGFDQLVEKRKTKEGIQGWNFSGKYY